MPSNLIERNVHTADGARIAYQVMGKGPAMVLANGLGGNAAAWRFLFERFSGTHKLVSWDYRGLYHSGPPPSMSRLAPPEQARDLFPILEAEGIDRFVLMGWSMGVQVAFEIYRAAPERVAAIGAINGVPGRPLDTAFNWRGSPHVLPATVRLWRRIHRWVTPVLESAVAWKRLLPTLKRLRLAGPSLDADVFLEIARGFTHLDFDVYCATMEALGRHDAWDILPKITVPTTIIAGDRDVMTPIDTAHRMASVIPHARLVILQGGTHYTPVEFADRVGDEVAALLALSGIAA